MKFAVVSVTATGFRTVEFASRFYVLAWAIAYAIRKNVPYGIDIEIAKLDCSAQAVLDLVHGKQELVELLYALVSRDEYGRWTTVFPEDMVLPGEAQAIANQVLA
jgi:hypothetical protein